MSWGGLQPVSPLPFGPSNPLPQSFEELIFESRKTRFEASLIEMLNLIDAQFSSFLDTTLLPGVVINLLGSTTPLTEPTKTEFKNTLRTQLIEEFYNNASIQAARNSIPAPIDTDPLLLTLQADFRNSLGITGAITSPANTGDWSILSPISSTDFKEQFNNATRYFLKNYQYDKPNSQSELDSLIEQFVEFTTPTALLQESSNSLVPFGGKNIIGYDEMFSSFFPSGVDGEGKTFQERIQSFYDKKIEQDGFFLPSHHMDEWFQDLQDEFLLNFQETTAIGTTKSTDGLQRVEILLRIFSLLTQLITTIQNVAATQAERLTLLARFQDAYTTLLNDLPIVTGGTGGGVAESGTTFNPVDGINTDDDEAQKENAARQGITSKTTALGEIVRGNRTLIQDRAKALQSTLNQSNDSSTQQANIATSIIQQLSTLLNSIYR